MRSGAAAAPARRSWRSPSGRRRPHRAGPDPRRPRPGRGRSRPGRSNGPPARRTGRSARHRRSRRAPAGGLRREAARPDATCSGRSRSRARGRQDARWRLRSRGRCSCGGCSSTHARTPGADTLTRSGRGPRGARASRRCGPPGRAARPPCPRRRARPPRSPRRGRGTRRAAERPRRAARAASAIRRLFFSTSAAAAWTSKSRASSLGAFIRETELAMGPASSTSRKRARSSPCRSAKWNASVSPVTWVIRNRLTASFISRAPGTVPQSKLSRHIGASSGRTDATTAGSPASIATSRPSSAGRREPETGASA